MDLFVTLEHKLACHIFTKSKSLVQCFRTSLIDTKFFVEFFTWNKNTPASVSTNWQHLHAEGCNTKRGKMYFFESGNSHCWALHECSRVLVKCFTKFYHSVAHSCICIFNIQAEDDDVNKLVSFYKNNCVKRKRWEWFVYCATLLGI